MQSSRSDKVDLIRGGSPLKSDHRTLFLILARSGSKRLPGKNLLEVGGVPLIGHAIRNARKAARRLGNRSKIVVSTDCENIASVARKWGAETPFIRPAHLADDNATTVDTMRHAVEFLACRGEAFTEIVLVQPTSPLAKAVDIQHTLTALRRVKNSSVLTVRPASGNSSPFLHGLHGEVIVAANQAHNENHLVELNGAVYACSPQWLHKNDTLCVPGKTIAVMMPAKRSVDVDTKKDYERACRLWEENLLWRPGRCLIVAEAGVNHNGSLETACRLIDEAKEAGADAVKFQTFTADHLTTRNAPKALYQKQNTGNDESQFDMLKKLELSPQAHKILIAHCRNQGILFLSSAFSEKAVDLLDKLDVTAIKLGSAEITNTPLLAHLGNTGKPVILSTGGSSLDEVSQAVKVLKESGCCELALLHCVSNYPAAVADVNLRAMDTLSREFNLPVGYSDHTEGLEVACAAVALGARIIEKHFTLDKNAPGPDHRASLEPKDLKRLVKAIRNVESAMGDGVKKPALSEADTRAAARRSLVAVSNLLAGTVLRREHLTCKRPGTGICPTQTEVVLGRKLVHNLMADEQLTWQHIQNEGD